MPDKREAMMRANVHEDVAFSNPGVDGQGLARLLGHMSAFKRNFRVGASRSTGYASSMVRCLRNGHSSTRTAQSS